MSVMHHITETPKRSGTSPEFPHGSHNVAIFTRWRGNVPYRPAKRTCANVGGRLALLGGSGAHSRGVRLGSLGLRLVVGLGKALGFQGWEQGRAASRCLDPRGSFVSSVE